MATARERKWNSLSYVCVQMLIALISLCKLVKNDPASQCQLVCFPESFLLQMLIHDLQNGDKWRALNQ